MESICGNVQSVLKSNHWSMVLCDSSAAEANLLNVVLHLNDQTLVCFDFNVAVYDNTTVTC